MFRTLALALSYPRAGLLEDLKAQSSAWPKHPAKQAFARFLEAIEGLGLSAWEELYTETLDMNPKLVPYVGYVVWGESYRRGDFMASLKAEMDRLGIDTGGELPDHLAPILRYLDLAEHPLPSLIEVLEPAVLRMKKDLAALSPQNPYLHLLDAILVRVGERFQKERRKG